MKKVALYLKQAKETYKEESKYFWEYIHASIKNKTPIYFKSGSKVKSAIPSGMDADGVYVQVNEKKLYVKVDKFFGIPQPLARNFY